MNDTQVLDGKPVLWEVENYDWSYQVGDLVTHPVLGTKWRVEIENWPVYYLQPARWRDRLRAFFVKSR